MLFCDTLFRRGFVVADINYRLSGDSIFPAQIYDCKAAVRWLKSRAAQYNIDTCKVAVIGNSAGGHLASLVGTSGGVDSLEDFGLGSSAATSRVHAVIPFYAPSDFLQIDAHFPRTPPDSCTNPLIANSPNSPESRLLGCQISVCPDRVRKANPMTYIDANDPPFKLYHGSFDCTAPPHQSVLMDSTLRERGVFSSLVILPHAPHAFLPNAAQKQGMLAFLNQRLAGCGPSGIDDGGRPDVPYRFELLQNYPNPFNPTTKLSFVIGSRSAGSLVSLKVFDVLGREVATLVNENLRAGTYEKTFDASGLASGVYFYNLKAGNFSASKKLLIMK
jgi:acetyl esterase/lipase